MRSSGALAFLLSLITPGLVASEVPKPQSAKEILNEGVRLYDFGNFEGALEKYRAALALQPGDPTTTYEVALALQALGRHAECAAMAEPMIPKVERLKRDFYVITASCIDNSGDPKRASAIFEAALREFPDDPQLLFNAGVTRLGGKEPALAKELLKDSVLLRPTHPASHVYLAMAFEQSGFTVPAILGNVRFLTLAPGDTRAPAAVLAIGRLLGLGVEQTSDTSTTLLIDPDASIEEGDFRQADMFRTMAAAAATTEEGKKKNDVVNFFGALDSQIGYLTEETAPAKLDFARAQLLPVARELRQQGLLEVFAYRALRPLSEEQTGPWLAAHAEKVAALDAFVREHGGH